MKNIPFHKGLYERLVGKEAMMTEIEGRLAQKDAQIVELKTKVAYLDAHPKG